MIKQKEFKIYEHDIFKAILLRPENKGIRKKITVDKNGSYSLRKKLTNKENFICELNILLIEIELKLKDLDYSTMFIGSFPNSWNKKMKRKDYIIYHLDFFYIGIQSIFDRVLHLTNFLYDLGLADRHAKVDIIISNSNIDDNTKRTLKEFDKRIEKIRKIQNAIKHKSKFTAKELCEIGIYEFVLNNDKDMPKSTENYLNFTINCDYKKFIEDKKKEMIYNKKAMDMLVKISLDALYPQFKKRIEKFD